MNRHTKALGSVALIVTLAGCDQFSGIVANVTGGTEEALVKAVKLVCKLPAAARTSAREKIAAALEPEGIAIQLTCTPEEAEALAETGEAEAADVDEVAAEVVEQAESEAAEATAEVEREMEEEAQVVDDATGGTQ